MKFNATPEKAISFTKLSVIFALCWPPPPTASRKYIFLFDLIWCVLFINSILLLLPLLNALYKHRGDSVLLGKNVCLSAAVSQVTLKMILSRLQRKRFQALIFEMENFCKHATVMERNVLQRYVNKCKYMNGCYTLWCYLSLCNVIMGPFFTTEMFPAPAEYPFPVEQQPLKSIIYLQQSLVGFQSSASINIDCQTALLLWYTAARFEILAMELSNIKDERDLNICIKKYNDIVRYSKEISKAVTFLVLITIMTTVVANIFGSLNMFVKQPIFLKAMYCFVVFNAGVELFMCAWPADNLINMAETISLGAYSSSWYNKNINIQKKIQRFIFRAQKPELIRISGILPCLSLSYYAAYLYTTFSYFTTLRIVIGSED